MKRLGEDALFVAGAARCVRCSICVAHCPSYSVFRNEADSPRGRVQLMRAAALGTLAPDAGFERHIDNCLGCRACEDVCPSGVPVGLLLDRTRAELAANGRYRIRKLVRRTGLHVIARRTQLNALARLLRVAQWLMLDRLARWIVRPFSRKLALQIAGAPRVAGSPYDPRSAAAPADPTVQLFAGCVMASALGDVQRATVRALAHSGHRVAAPPRQVCCGALHQHAGLPDRARSLARANLDAFSGDVPICVNSAGCSLAMKDYPHLLPDDPRATAFAARIRDLSELVTAPPSLAGRRVAVQEACHHHNVQRLRGSAATVLARAGATVVQLPRGAGCCGSAGLWGGDHPDAAAQLLGPLLDAIEHSGCDAVVSSNPGCLLAIRAGLRERGATIRALHLAELLG